MESGTDEQDRFVNCYPFFTRHSKKAGDRRGVYWTYLFGLVTLAKYRDPEISAIQVCIEPLRELAMRGLCRKFL
jgi:hypothetical protein